MATRSKASLRRILGGRRYVPQGRELGSSGERPHRVESINLSEWIAGNPDLLLSTSFRAPENVLAKFRKGTEIGPLT